MQLLKEAGFIAASEVELRIDPGAHPEPDVIATRSKFPSGPYPTEALGVVVEIISDATNVTQYNTNFRKRLCRT